jgi:hypothetical protein
LSDDLGITSRLRRRRVMRAIRIKLLGVADPPDTPTVAAATAAATKTTVTVTWQRPRDNGMLTHGYRVQRRGGNSGGGGRGRCGGDAWIDLNAAQRTRAFQPLPNSPIAAAVAAAAAASSSSASAASTASAASASSSAAAVHGDASSFYFRFVAQPPTSGTSLYKKKCSSRWRCSL